MHKQKNFHIGSPVQAVSLSGHKITGVYRGSASNYGCWVYGYNSELFASPDKTYSLHKCARLSLKLIQETTKPETNSKIRLHYGEPCRGMTPDSQIVIGEYMQASGQYAYIRGVLVSNPLEKKSIKVLRSSLQKDA